MGSSKASDAAPPPRPSRGWDATAHEALLLCIIDEVKGGKALMTEVTKKMQARGYTYSYDAIKYIPSTFPSLSLYIHIYLTTHLWSLHVRLSSSC
jgi:hypothetical protein